MVGVKVAVSGAVSVSGDVPLIAVEVARERWASSIKIGAIGWGIVPGIVPC